MNDLELDLADHCQMFLELLKKDFFDTIFEAIYIPNSIKLCVYIFGD